MVAERTNCTLCNKQAYMFLSQFADQTSESAHPSSNHFETERLIDLGRNFKLLI